MVKQNKCADEDVNTVYCILIQASRWSAHFNRFSIQNKNLLLVSMIHEGICVKALPAVINVGCCCLRCDLEDRSELMDSELSCSTWTNWPWNSPQCLVSVCLVLFALSFIFYEWVAGPLNAVGSLTRRCNPRHSEGILPVYCDTHSVFLNRWRLLELK